MKLNKFLIFLIFNLAATELIAAETNEKTRKIAKEEIAFYMQTQQFMINTIIGVLGIFTVLSVGTSIKLVIDERKIRADYAEVIKKLNNDLAKEIEKNVSNYDKKTSRLTKSYEASLENELELFRHRVTIYYLAKKHISEADIESFVFPSVTYLESMGSEKDSLLLQRLKFAENLSLETKARIDKAVKKITSRQF